MSNRMYQCRLDLFMTSWWHSSSTWPNCALWYHHPTARDPHGGLPLGKLSPMLILSKQEVNKNLLLFLTLLIKKLVSIE
jgi:hypothetical protein